MAKSPLPGTGRERASSADEAQEGVLASFIVAHFVLLSGYDFH